MTIVSSNHSSMDSWFMGTYRGPCEFSHVMMCFLEDAVKDCRATWSFCFFQSSSLGSCEVGQRCMNSLFVDERLSVRTQRIFYGQWQESVSGRAEARLDRRSSL